ncbi:acyl carrier protein [Dielma fastidiosa]|uniref:acyl carrier protein n=1 Tax=Dielma fastidiosa TaxID=1034346 RepID=UPI0035648E29
MTIKEEAIQVLCKKAANLFGMDEKVLGADTRFEEDLHCKSTNIVQFSAALEDAFEIEVPFMELKKKKTFGEAADWLANQL